MAKKKEIATTEQTSIRSIEQVESLILTIRGKQVILDRDLARLYGVETRVLNQAVQRNIERFPEDFMFRLTKEEAEFLKSQIVILETGKNMSSQFVTTSPQNWVIIDDTLYHCGHSVKDLGKKLSAIMKMDWDPEVVLKEVR